MLKLCTDYADLERENQQSIYKDKQMELAPDLHVSRKAYNTDQPCGGALLLVGRLTERQK
jgi:hypothetical protein